MTRTSQLILCACMVIVDASTLRGQTNYPVDFRVGVHTASTKRNASLADTIVGRSSASLIGFDVMISPPGGEVGIGARMMSGSYPQGNLSFKEALLFVGGNVFHVEAGYGQRSLFGTDSLITFARGGFRWLVQIGGSGVSLSVNGSGYSPGDFHPVETSGSSGSHTSSAFLGWEGETNIFYTLTKVPIFAQLGYRTEYFKYGKREESLNGLVLGTGLWLGGR